MSAPRSDVTAKQQAQGEVKSSTVAFVRKPNKGWLDLELNDYSSQIAYDSIPFFNKVVLNALGNNLFELAFHYPKNEAEFAMLLNKLNCYPDSLEKKFSCYVIRMSRAYVTDILLAIYAKGYLSLDLLQDMHQSIDASLEQLKKQREDYEHCIAKKIAEEEGDKLWRRVTIEEQRIKEKKETLKAVEEKDGQLKQEKIRNIFHVFFREITNIAILSSLSAKDLERFCAIVSEQLKYKVPLSGIFNLDQSKFSRYQSEVEKFKSIEKMLVEKGVNTAFLKGQLSRFEQGLKELFIKTKNREEAALRI